MSDKDDMIDEFSDAFKRNPAFGFDVPDVDVVPTGLFTLDSTVFGCGGLPRGRVVVGFGWEATGKSLMGHFFSACGTKANPNYKTMWIDLEGAFVRRWAEKIGQSMENTIIPNYEMDEDGEYSRKVVTMEEVLTYVKWGITKGIDLIVIDSIQELVPKIVMDRNLEERKANKLSEKARRDAMMEISERGLKMNEVTYQARMFSQIWQKELMNGFEFQGEYHALPNSDTTIYMINQIRSNPDAGKHGKREVESGGNALRFLARMKFKLTRTGVSEKKTRTGAPLYEVLALDCVKNQLAPPFRGTEIVIHWDGRVEETSEFIVNHAVEKEIVSVARSWYNTPWGKAQGMRKCADLLRKNIEELDLSIKRVDEEEVVSEEELEEGRSAERDEALMDLVDNAGDNDE